MSYCHVCNHKGLMLCVMLPNFNHTLKPALTLSTIEMIFHKMALVIKSSAASINPSHYFPNHSIFLSHFLTNTHTHTHTHTHSDSPTPTCGPNLQLSTPTCVPAQAHTGTAVVPTLMSSPEPQTNTDLSKPG